MTLEDKFNGLKSGSREQQALLDRGYGDRFIAMMAKDGYDTGRTLKESFDQLGEHVRINYNTLNLRINLLLRGNKDVKYVLMNPPEGTAIYAFDARHEGIVDAMSDDAKKCAKEDLPSVWYNSEWDDDQDKYAHIGGGFMELALDAAGRPYVSVFGQSGDYGRADHHKTVELLRSIGINAKVDEARATYMRS